MIITALRGLICVKHLVDNVRAAWLTG